MGSSVLTRVPPSDAAAPPVVRRPRRGRGGSGSGLAYGTLIVVVLFNLAVFAWLVLEALKPNDEFLSTRPWELPSHWAWDNFTNAWRNANIKSYFVNSIIVSFGATLLSLAVVVPAAYSLARVPRSRASGWLRQLFFVGLLMPPVVLIVPLYFELSAVHMLNSLAGLVIVYAGLSLPFSIWYLSSFFKALPPELEEAAAIDGASPFRAFLLVFLPNALSGCFAVFVVNFLWAWNEFFYALTFLDTKYTIAVGVFNLQQNAEYSADWVTLFAGMLISVVPVLCLYAVLSEQITRAMAEGAVKG
jgi:raffinose/stachyose/melibiose transport system permease protein/N-acetylglucosamine transport system permease protein